MILDTNTKLDFHDVLIKPKRSTLESRSDVELLRYFKPKYRNPFTAIPIMAANMATGSMPMLLSLRKYDMLTAIAKHNVDAYIEAVKANTNLLHTGIYTIGMNDSELEKFGNFYNDVLHDGYAIKLCIDIANGYTQKFADFVKKARTQCPKAVIIAGNVATPEMVQELVIAGADFVKVGIGPGSQCTTRLKTGVGYPQISACIECADAAHGLGAGIVLDGGMRSAGDIAKAFCANADFIMVGGMFAGTDECDGEVISKYFQSNELEPPMIRFGKDNTQTVIPNLSANKSEWTPKVIEKKFKLFYGMSSEYAQDKHGAGLKEYRASVGRVEEVECKGPVDVVVKDLLGGLRSTGTYIGAESIKQFGKCATLVRVSRVHDRF